MPYKRLRQGEIKNAYFWVIFGWRLEKKTWQISLLKMYFFTEQNLVLSLLCLQIKQHTDGQLYILHPDECRYLWHAPEWKMILSPYFQILQAVIVQDAVIDTFTGCAFAVYLPVLFGIPWNAGMEAEVAVVLYVDGAPVVSGGTLLCMGAGIYAPAF